MLQLRRHRKSLRRHHALPIVERLESRALLALTATSVALGVPSQAIDYGQAEMLTATVTAAGGLTVPDGEMVTFSSGGTALGSAPLVKGVATLSTATFNTGSYTVTAAYGGDASFAPSRSNFEPASSRTVIPTTGLSDNLGLAVDSSGNVYITDAFNNRVVKVTPAGVQSTAVSDITFPFGVAVDDPGDLFIAGHAQVIEVTPSGTRTTLPFSGLKTPFGVALDGAGNVFVTDAGNGTVLKLTPGGTQTVVASGLDMPGGIAVDAEGNVFVAEAGAGQVVEVSPAGAETTVVSGLNQPQGVAVDGAGDVFTNDSGANARVLEVPPSGVTATLVSGLTTPAALLVAASGDLYFSDAATLQVLKMTPGVPLTIVPDQTAVDLTVSGATQTSGGAGTLTATVAAAHGAPVPDGEIVSFSSGGAVLGTAPLVSGVATLPTTAIPAGSYTVIATYGGDANLRASNSGVEPSSPRAVVPATGLSDTLGVAVDGANNIYITDSFNNRVVQVTPAGVQSTAVSDVTSPIGVTVDRSGDLFISQSTLNQVVKVTPAGARSTVPLTGLNRPLDVAVDGVGNVYVADTGNNRVVEITPAGTQTSIASDLNGPVGVAVDALGNVFIADTMNNRVVEVTAAGVETTVVSGLHQPQQVAVDSSEDLFITELASMDVVKVAPTGVMTTIAAGLTAPAAVAVGPADNVVFGDAGTIKVVNVTPGVPLTIARSATSVAVTVSAGVVSFGRPVTFTATVTAAGGLMVPDGESVAFSSGTTVLDSAPLTSNVAKFTTAALAPGSYNVVGNYGGDANFLPSTASSTAAVTVNQAVPTFAVNKASISYGTETTTLSGTLADGPVVPPAGETVRVTLAGVTQTATLGPGGAFAVPFATAMLGVAGSPYAVTYAYSGDADFESATATSALTVTKLTPTLVVHGASASYDGSAHPATFTITGVNGDDLSGQTTLTYNGSPTAPVNAGSYVVAASFPGSDNYNPVSDNSQRVEIASAATKVLLTSSANPSTAGEVVTLTAVVTPETAGAASPAGSVTFYDGATMLAAVPLSFVNGASQAQFLTPGLPVGTHAITATYVSASGNYVGSFASLSQTVKRAALLTSPEPGPSSPTATAPGPGVYTIGSALYVVGANTADSVDIEPAGLRSDGTTGVRVSATLNNVTTAQTLSQTLTSIVILGGNGDNHLTIASSVTLPATITAGDGNNVITFGAGNHVVVLGAGNNRVSGGNGNNSITARGSAGKTIAISLGAGDQTIRLGDADAEVILGNGNSTVVAGNGRDVIKLGNGNNTVNLGNGRDTIIAGNGHDVVRAGNRKDVVRLRRGGHDIVKLGK